MQSFESKIPPPIIAAIAAAVMWGFSFIVPAIRLGPVARTTAIIVLLVSGIYFGISGIVSFKKAATTTNPLKPETASSLVCSGIYKVSRNPMYVGLALVLLAWAVYLSSAWVIIGIFGFVLYMNQFQIVPEERALTELFGAEYLNYQSRVSRWL